MYIFYTHTKDATGKIILTELKLSSRPNRWIINFFLSTEKAQFMLIKESALKVPPIAMRSYDDSTKIWTFMESHGVQVLENAVKVTQLLGGVSLIEVPDLHAIASLSSFDYTKIPKQIKPEDFFYNPTGGNAAVSTVLDKATVQQKLALLLEVSSTDLATAQNGELKKLYRRAALRLHPDRNNGDGSQMSELNMLWSMYNELGGLSNG